jgi:glycosyltransferase involved in cell wall biosynthesis
MLTSSAPTATDLSAQPKLRVLFLATRDWYHPATTGGDNTMWENARYLASVGHHVVYVAAGYPGAPRRETRDGIEVNRLGGVHTLWLTTFAYYMSRCRGRYDVVVAEGFGGSRIPRWAPLYVKEPIITEWHQVHRRLFAAQYPKLLNGPLNALERLTAWVHRDTLVRAGTSDWQAPFVDLGFRRDRVFMLPVTIRDDWLDQPRREPSTRPVILWLGKLRRYKCPDHLVRAMPAVLEKVPDAELTIAGRSDDAGYACELEHLAARLGVAGHVHFRWDLSEAEKVELIRSSRLVAVTSAVEGFGIVVLEANACGVPVVASTGVPEGAVQEGVNGLRYPFGNVAALARRVVELMQDQALYERLSKTASEHVKRFSWSRVGAEFASVVARAAARTG